MRMRWCTVRTPSGAFLVLACKETDRHTYVFSTIKGSSMYATLREATVECDNRNAEGPPTSKHFHEFDPHPPTHPTTPITPPSMRLRPPRKKKESK